MSAFFYLLRELFQFEKCVSYANEMIDNNIHSTQYPWIGSTPIYGLYRYVLQNRLRFLRFLVHKVGYLF